MNNPQNPHQNTNALPQVGGAAHGGLASYQMLSKDQNVEVAGGSGPWSATWDGRKPYGDFYVIKGGQHQLVFLSDAIPFVHYSVLTGWQAGDRGGFPRREHVRCARFAGLDHQNQAIWNNNPDPFQSALGSTPRFGYLAAVLDNTPFTPKDHQGPPIPWRIRYLIMDQSVLMDQFSAFTGLKGRNLQYSCWQVTRANQPRTARLGTWMPIRYVGEDQGITDPTQIMQMIEGSVAPREMSIGQACAGLDFDRLFPVYKEEDARAILGLHRRICDEHPGQRGLSYNAEAMNQICGPAAMPRGGAPGAPMGYQAFGAPQQQQQQQWQGGGQAHPQQGQAQGFGAPPQQQPGQAQGFGFPPQGQQPPQQQGQGFGAPAPAPAAPVEQFPWGDGQPAQQQAPGGLFPNAQPAQQVQQQAPAPGGLPFTPPVAGNPAQAPEAATLPQGTAQPDLSVLSGIRTTGDALGQLQDVPDGTAPAITQEQKPADPLGDVFGDGAAQAPPAN